MIYLVIKINFEMTSLSIPAFANKIVEYANSYNPRILNEIQRYRKNLHAENISSTDPQKKHIRRINQKYGNQLDN